MRFLNCCIALSLAVLTPAAFAQDAAHAVKSGAMLKSSDGKRIGRIERIVSSKDGTPVSASVIYDSRFVYVPVATISTGEGGYVTSLSRDAVRKLK